MKTKLCVLVEDRGPFEPSAFHKAQNEGSFPRHTQSKLREKMFPESQGSFLISQGYRKKPSRSELPQTEQDLHQTNDFQAMWISQLRVVGIENEEYKATLMIEEIC